MISSTKPEVHNSIATMPEEDQELTVRAHTFAAPH